MNKFPENTEWRLSAKGNHWRNKNGITLVVGGSDKDGYWVRIGDQFHPDRQATFEDACLVAENGV